MEIEETPEGLHVTANLGPAPAMTEMANFTAVGSSGSSYGMDGSARRWRQKPGEEPVHEVRVRGLATEDTWALDQLQRVYTCGCGNPESAYELVRDVLRLMPLYDDHWEACEQLIGSEGAFHIVLDVMTNADLIEHGGSVGGSWMRPEGERLLAVLDPIEDFDAWRDQVGKAQWVWQPDPDHA